MSTSLSLVPASDGGEGSASGDTLAVVYSDGSVDDMQRDVLLYSPFIRDLVLRHGASTAVDSPLVLPPQINQDTMGLILEYARYHATPGHSDKELKIFDERFLKQLDTRRLCELTSAADTLQIRSLVDITSKALARLIEGRSAEEIREAFQLPDDLTEEEKLEPLKSVDGIPRLRLLNRLNAKRLKELQERKLLEAAASGTAAPMSKEQQQDGRSVEELLSFIDGGTETKTNKKKGKAKRAAKAQSNEQATPEDGRQQDAVAGDGSHAGNEAPSETLFPETGFDDSDGGEPELDPSLSEQIDREVEAFALRLSASRRAERDASSAGGQVQAGHLAEALHPALRKLLNKLGLTGLLQIQSGKSSTRSGQLTSADADITTSVALPSGGTLRVRITTTQEGSP